MALSPDRRKLYVTNIGMFEYQAIPGADAETGERHRTRRSPPSASRAPEAVAGAERATERGTVKVPGLGDPNVRESNSVVRRRCLRLPPRRKWRASFAPACRSAPDVHGGSSPSGILATADRVFVSNANDDSITVIDAKTNQVEAEIPIRIPGLETLPRRPADRPRVPREIRLAAGGRGRHQRGRRDRRASEAACSGTLPAAWFPTRVAVDRRHGVRGQRARPRAGAESVRRADRCGRARVSIFPLPAAGELAAQTAFVMEANGFRAAPSAGAPAAGRHQARGPDRQGESHLRRSLRRYSGCAWALPEMRALRNARLRGRQTQAAEHQAISTSRPTTTPWRASGPSATTSMPIATSAWTGITGWWAPIPMRGPKAR